MANNLLCGNGLMKEDEQYILCGLAGITIFVLLIFSWVFFTDEYSVRTHTQTVCTKYKNELVIGVAAKTICIEEVIETTYDCKMANGEIFAVCKDAKRCEKVCNKLRE